VRNWAIPTAAKEFDTSITVTHARGLLNGVAEIPEVAAAGDNIAPRGCRPLRRRWVFSPLVIGPVPHPSPRSFVTAAVLQRNSFPR